MRLLRPLLATLAISLTLPLSAEIEKKIHVDTEPHVIHSGDSQDLSDHIEEPYNCDTKDSLFWFRLEAGATLNIDAGLELATVRIETAAPPNNAASLVFAERSYFGHEINYQTAPIELLRAKDKQDGTLIISSPAWTESDESGTQSKQRWDPQSLKVDCNLIFAAPLPIDKTEETFTLPAGCTFRLEAYASDERQLPNIVFADETSTLVFPKITTNTELPEKYRKRLASSSGRFVFERDITITPQLTFTASPTVEVAGTELSFSNTLIRNGGAPSIILKEGGILTGSNLSTVIVEGEVVINGNSSLDCLTGHGTVNNSRNTAVKIKTIQVEEGKELKTTNSFIIENLQEIKGSGTLSLGEVYQNGAPSEWKVLDAILRKGGFTGTFGYTSKAYYNKLDFTQIKSNTFDYTLMPSYTNGMTSSAIVKITMRLEQYANLKIKWPTEKLNQIHLELIESGSFNGTATVPAFPEALKKSFTFLSADGNEIDCKVEYGEETNTLTWKPTTPVTPGFVGLPDDVNQMLAPGIPEGAITGTVICEYTVEEAAEALRAFSGIHKIVSRTDGTTETNIVDLHVDYSFGISRLTFVDKGENVLVEVSLTSNASPSPTILGKITLSANGHALEDVTELSSEEVAERKLSAPEGATVRWFRVPYDSLPEAEDLTAITVTANPPPQAN